MHDGGIRRCRRARGDLRASERHVRGGGRRAANFFNIVVDDRGVAHDAGGVRSSPLSRPRRRAGARDDLPDRLRIDADPGTGLSANTLRGMVKQRLFMGGYYEYVVATDAGAARVLSPREFAENALVVLSFDASDCIFLPGA